MPSNEYALIKAIENILTFSGKTPFKLGIGDDAALRICQPEEQLVFTADILVEDVHFSLEYMSLEEIGYKAMVANISDCAAMASIPDSAMIQLVFPKGSLNIKDEILQLYKGIDRASKEYDFPVIGGDLSVGDKWVIGVSMTGREDSNERLLFRKGANVGDEIWVTGKLGGSAAGLEVLKQFGRSNDYQDLINMHISPKARIEEGLLLARDSAVTTLTDISDGIGKECKTLAYENDLSVEIDINESLLPDNAIEFANKINIDPFKWVLNGGEDYELLFTAQNFKKEKYPDWGLIKIGNIVQSGYGIQFKTKGTILLNDSVNGWDHFKNQ